MAPSSLELTAYLRELLRMASRAVMASEEAQILVNAASEGREGLAEAVAFAESALANALEPVVVEALDAFGLRPRRQISVADISRALVVAVTAVETRAKGVVADGAEGSESPWTMLGLTAVGVVALATEPDPHKAVSADPARLLDLSGPAVSCSI